MTPSLERLIAKLSSLPGIGRKSAGRLAYHIVSMDQSQVDEIATALTDAKRSLKLCEICQNYSETPVCSVCASEKRDKSVICVVEDPRSVTAIEDLREYSGTYHVQIGRASCRERV